VQKDRPAHYGLGHNRGRLRASRIRSANSQVTGQFRGVGFTFTVLDPGDHDVIGCVYLYPSASEEWDVTVQSWVRADRSTLDGPLADAVAGWLATDWPWMRVDRRGR
jgi:hypothetical protein